MSSNCVSAERCLYAEDGPTPAELMTLYLAWIMKQARQHVPSSLKKNKTSFVFNVGVPVKHLDEGEGGTLAFHYGKIVYDAWCLSDGLAQGIQMPVCQEWIHQLKGISPPEPANSPVQLATETSAAIVSYINSPDSKSGLCSIVDIGAWTTDVSFFRVTDIAMATTGTPRLAFYAADVWHKAANAIDDRIIRCIIELVGNESILAFSDKDLAMHLRQQRELNGLKTMAIQFKMPDGKDDVTAIPDCVIDFSRVVTSESVRRSFSSTFKDARKKDPKIEAWKNFTIFLTGGGSHESCCLENIRKRYSGLEPRIRSDILGSPALTMEGDTDLFKRMAVAAGLSYPLGTWPDQLRPSQVQELKKPPMRRIAEADDEPG